MGLYCDLGSYIVRHWRYFAPYGGYVLRSGCYVALKHHGEKLFTYEPDWKGCKYTFVHKRKCKGQ
jgi:hypothetical protein